MALFIDDPATDALVRELAAETGESITVAARIAIEERLARVRARATSPDVEDEVRAIIARGRERAVLDDRSAEEILGYDEHGLPR
ncbi:MAG: type II toxin-antitoxin system VapB family antitoxin [Propionibacteriaceae bacterium]|nr:type II toxin-antitoxin system VapB family antitoxin [Propionibacteriaceae bacterium]